MDFGQALRGLKNGRAVQRRTWADTICIYIVMDPHLDGMRIPQEVLADTPTPFFAESYGGRTDMVMVSLSTTDMLAEDWVNCALPLV